MFAFLTKILLVVRSRLKSQARLEAEILVLRQQVIVLSRRSGARVWLKNIDRLIFVWIFRLFPSVLDAITVVKPETVIPWHRRGFRAYWRWKSRRHGGRPRIDREIRDLIRRMNKENPLWGAPRIHGELLMLGIEVAQSTVTRYMTTAQAPPSQSWKTFLRNHAAGIASIDLFVVRTISFKLLYGLVILRHARRRLVTISVTSNPTAEWIAGQVTDAFPWDEAPRHERHAMGVEQLDHSGEVGQRSGQAIDLVHDHDIDRALANVRHELLYRRSFRRTAREAPVVVGRLDQLPALAGLTPDERFARFALCVQRVVILLQSLFRGFAGVDRATPDRGISHVPPPWPGPSGRRTAVPTSGCR